MPLNDETNQKNFSLNFSPNVFCFFCFFFFCCFFCLYWFLNDLKLKKGKNILKIWSLNFSNPKATNLSICLSIYLIQYVLTDLSQCVRISLSIYFYPVTWGCRIHWLHLGRGVRPLLTSVLDMTLNNLMVWFQQCWSFGECRVLLHCHCSQVHSGPEW